MSEELLRQLNLGVGIATLLALLWYAYETLRLRRATEAQTTQILMPILRLQHQEQRLLLSNIGPGIARSVLMQPIRYVNWAGDLITLEFKPIVALSTGSTEFLQPTIRRREVGEEDFLELGPTRIDDVLEAFGTGRNTEWLQAIYFCNARGEAYEAEFRWEEPDRPAAVVGLGRQEPRLTDIRPIHSLPRHPQYLELKGVSRIP